MYRDFVRGAAIASCFLFTADAASAADRIVGTTAEFSAALADAVAGDEMFGAVR